MDRIQTQASKLWDILFDEETAQTYQTALSLTGDILKESAQLIWLVLCSFFVFGAWFGDASMKTGKGVRDWVDQKDAVLPNPDAPKVGASQKGKSLLDSSRESAANLLAKAREELGLDPNAPLAAPREDSPVAKLVTPSEEKTSSAPAATASSTTTSSAASSSTTTSSPSASSTTTSSPAAEPVAATDSSPAEGAATARPATSEGQDIGASRASSRGSGASGIGFGNPYGGRSSGSQSGGSHSSKYDKQDFDDDPGDEDDVDDSSWPPHSEDD